MAKRKRSRPHRLAQHSRRKKPISFHQRLSYWILATIIIAGMFYGMSALVERKHPHISGSDIANPSLLHDERPFDITFGDINAPITIIEYASLTCGHCKYFHQDVFPHLKAQFIDSGKLRFIYRHYPLNKPALEAALLVSCLPTDIAQRSILKTLFATQEQWGHTSPEYNQSGALRRQFSSLSDAEYQSCLSNKHREKALLNEQLRAQKELGINSTPTIFINGELYRKQRSIGMLSQIIEKHLSY